jgi:hypothetical protein
MIKWILGILITLKMKSGIVANMNGSQGLTHILKTVLLALFVVVRENRNEMVAFIGLLPRGVVMVGKDVIHELPCSGGHCKEEARG